MEDFLSSLGPLDLDLDLLVELCVEEELDSEEGLSELAEEGTGEGVCVVC
jgi:hypothetical protein